jgi:hypothetical protein
MAALRAMLGALGEPPGMPPGASCTMDAQGVATVFDPATRRKFLLTPLSSPAARAVETPVSVSRHQVDSPRGKALPAMATAQRQTGAEPDIDAHMQVGEMPRIDTVDFADAAGPRRKIPRPAAPAAAPPQPPAAPGVAGGSPIALELLLERDEDPGPGNPLCYRERAYFMPPGGTAAEAEAALRLQLAELQRALVGRANRFVALAAFDHRWQEEPERPATVVLQWRDWRSEIDVEYPASVHFSSIPPPVGSAQDERLSEVFDAAEALSQLTTPVEGLDFVLGLLEETIPSEAISVCIYDASSDELRFVAVAGPFSASMQGYGVPRSAGLFGRALKSEHQASVFVDVLVEPAFNPLIDSRPGLDPRNLLLRPVVHERELLGMLQLINRQGTGTFTSQDLHVANYVAERLADFLHTTRGV